jgi:hypothetical protein
MLSSLHVAYGDLARTQLDLERRMVEIDETRELFERVIESMSEALFLPARLAIAHSPALTGRPGAAGRDLRVQPAERFPHALMAGTVRRGLRPRCLLQARHGEADFWVELARHICESYDR